MPLQIGQVLHGYCGGYFGDQYSCVRVEAVGIDWVVAREIGYRNRVYFADDPEIHQKLAEYVKKTEDCRCPQ